nr:unnamed protein product [Naegleria fowleri]
MNPPAEPPQDSQQRKKNPLHSTMMSAGMNSLQSLSSSSLIGNVNHSQFTKSSASLEGGSSSSFDPTTTRTNITTSTTLTPQTQRQKRPNRGVRSTTPVALISKSCHHSASTPQPYASSSNLNAFLGSFTSQVNSSSMGLSMQEFTRAHHDPQQGVMMTVSSPPHHHHLHYDPQQDDSHDHHLSSSSAPQIYSPFTMMYTTQQQPQQQPPQQTPPESTNQPQKPFMACYFPRQPQNLERSQSQALTSPQTSVVVSFGEHPKETCQNVLFVGNDNQQRTIQEKVKTKPVMQLPSIDEWYQKEGGDVEKSSLLYNKLLLSTNNKKRKIEKQQQRENHKEELSIHPHVSTAIPSSNHSKVGPISTNLVDATSGLEISGIVVNHFDSYNDKLNVDESSLGRSGGHGMDSHRFLSKNFPSTLHATSRPNVRGHKTMTLFTDHQSSSQSLSTTTRPIQQPPFSSLSTTAITQQQPTCPSNVVGMEKMINLDTTNDMSNHHAITLVTTPTTNQQPLLKHATTTTTTTTLVTISGHNHPQPPHVTTNYLKDDHPPLLPQQQHVNSNEQDLSSTRSFIHLSQPSHVESSSDSPHPFQPVMHVQQYGFPNDPQQQQTSTSLMVPSSLTFPQQTTTSSTTGNLGHTVTMSNIEWISSSTTTMTPQSSPRMKKQKRKPKSSSSTPVAFQNETCSSPQLSPSSFNNNNTRFPVKYNNTSIPPYPLNSTPPLQQLQFMDSNSSSPKASNNNQRRRKSSPSVITNPTNGFLMQNEYEQFNKGEHDIQRKAKGEKIIKYTHYKF